MNIIITAVGGQGALFAARVIGTAAAASGYDVKMSEVHGMSQRGGSVITHVRFGEKIASPIVEEGSADCILAFEELEAARYISTVKRGGIVIINTQQINPVPVASGLAVYPKNVAGALSALGVMVEAIDGVALAKKAGDVRSVNAVLLGVLARHITLDHARWLDALSVVSPVKACAINVSAFESGFSGIDKA